MADQGTPGGAYDCDFLVIGSGFGGSVAALRLAEKGYRVVVLEAGKRWRREDFPLTNWNVRKFLWAPALGCHGIQRIHVFRHFLALGGAGVGGGSLVYAATLYTPPDSFFRDPQWAHLDRDWKATLDPHYATARRMLGVTRNPRLQQADHLLQDYAKQIGREAHFHSTEVGIYFGEPGKTVPDPLLGGEGPERTGCDFSAGCMVGCRGDGKNTLDKNYLYLAEKRGVRIIPETLVTGVRDDGQGGFQVHSRRATAVLSREQRTWRARQVVVAAGTAETIKLLAASQADGGLPRLSQRLGDWVRTNSEVIVGARSTRKDARFCEGIAISSSLHITDDTHVEIVRYNEGSDVMGAIASVLTDGGSAWSRPLKFLLTCLLHPVHLLRSLWLPGWAKQSVILLTMQSLANHLALRLQRSWFPPWGRTLQSRSPAALPTYIPEANAAARFFADKIDGFPQGAISEVFLNRPLTAHVLGGCVMGAHAGEGVVDRAGQAFGHPGLYVVGGAIVPANLGVNPSLTITALAEHVMATIPPKAA